jgi:hypothetical protein
MPMAPSAPQEQADGAIGVSAGGQRDGPHGAAIRRVEVNVKDPAASGPQDPSR